MDYYILTKNVLFFNNYFNRGFNTLIVEKDKKIKLYIEPFKLLKRSCKWYGNSYQIQREFIVDKFNYYIKTPIIVYQKEMLIFFPTNAPKSDNCIWICFNNIDRYIKNNNQTTIYFKGGKTYNFNVSYRTIDNQITKCIKIEKYLNDFILKGV